MRRFAAILFAALALASPSRVGADDILDKVPEEYRQGVSRALSGGSGSMLRAAFAKLEGEEVEGFAFLAANMPPHKLQKVTEPVLVEHLEYAYRARAELPWSKDVPKETFLHYVLPILSGDEKPEAYRKRFFEEVAPVLRKKRVRSLEQAALEVNKWCGQRVTFKPSPPEDASPLETLERGFGRCEEEAIFYNAVARSVGVPARTASTPYWTFKASNHAWSEVYTGGGKKKKATRPWRYLGACEPSGKLDQAWFTGQIGRAALVLSRTIGVPEGEHVLATVGTSSVVNSTRYYTKTCGMTLEVVGPGGDPAGGARVTLYIFNEVGNEPFMRSVFEAKADGEGRFAFDLGPGDYLVHAKGTDGVGTAIARSLPGKKASCRIALGSPVPGEHKTRDSGKSGIRLVPGPGAKKGTAGICPLSAFPFKPDRMVAFEKRGTEVELPPGRYFVQTSRRKGDAAVHLTAQVVEVPAGGLVTVAVPGIFPKRPPKVQTGPAYVLTYPR